MASRRKQMNPRAMKSLSMEVDGSNADGDDDPQDDSLDIDDDLPLSNELDDSDSVKMVKSSETPTSAASFNDDTNLSDIGEQDVLNALDMTGDEKKTRSSSNGASTNGVDTSPFECHICHRKFKHRRSKSRHIMYHTGQKRHFCRYCNASFYRSDHLKAHTRTHTIPGLLDAENGDNGAKRLAQIHKDDGEEDLGIPPTKIPHRDDSLAADFSSEQNSNFEGAIPLTHNETDIRYSMSTPIYFNEPNEQVANNRLQVNETSENAGRRCPFCQTSFTTADMLRRHLREENCTLHPESSSHSNTVKQKSFAMPDPISSQNCRGSPPIFTCPICPLGQQPQFNQANVLTTHLASEHRFSQESLNKNQPKGPTSFICPSCDLETHSLAKFHQHMYSAHLKFSYRCSLCDFSTHESDSISKHFFTSHCRTMNSSELKKQEGSFNSSSGALDFSSAGNSDRRVVSTSSQCQLCSTSFPNRDSLSSHLVASHQWIRCSFCSKAVSSERILTKHLEIEHKLKQNQDVQLRSIANTKSSQSPYQSDSVIQCLACSRTFRGRMAMKQHLIQFHHFDHDSKAFCFADETYYVCDICPDVFRGADILAEHNASLHPQLVQISTQSNSRRVGTQSSLACRFCNAIFSVAFELEKHIIEKHSEDLLKTTTKVVQGVNQPKAHIASSPRKPTTNGLKREGGSLIHCQQCSAAFDSQYALEMHTFEEHLMNAVRANGTGLSDDKHDDESSSAQFVVPKRFQCNICDRIFADSPTLFQHRTVEHKFDSSLKQWCSQCEIRLVTLADFVKHASSHRKGNGALACCLCNEYLEDMADMTKHGLNVHYTGSNTSCAVCEAPILDERVAKKINLNGSSELVLACGDCSSKNEDSRHCQLCNALFDSTENLKSHNLKYHPVINSQSTKSKQNPNKVLQNLPLYPTPVNLQCSLCETLCDSEESLTTHLVEHSFPNGEYKCPICAEDGEVEEFESAVDLEQHVKSHPSNVIASSGCLCTECNRTFLWSAEFTHHAAQHDLEREEHASQPVPSAAQTRAATAALQNVVANLSAQNFDCNACNRSFPTIRSLANHQRQCLSAKNQRIQQDHSEETNGDTTSEFPNIQQTAMKVADPSEFLRCYVCRNKFANAQSLQKHARTIHGLDSAEFWCCLCDSKLVNYKQLLHHLQTEHDINIAQSICELCGDSFTMLKNLKRHLKRVHKFNYQASGVPVAPIPALSCSMQQRMVGNEIASIETSEDSPEDQVIAVTDDC